MPLDVCRLQPKKLVLYADIESADGATALVLAQNLVAESRVPSRDVRTITSACQKIDIYLNPKNK